MLEESLAEFPGALVLVTHDRFMLERVSTAILALDGRGGTATFADYAQWEAARTPRASGAAQAAPSAAVRSATARGPGVSGIASSASGTAWSRRSWTPKARSQTCRRAMEDPAIAADPTALQQRVAALEGARAEVDRLLRALGRAGDQTGVAVRRSVMHPGLIVGEKIPDLEPPITGASA